MTSHQLIDAAVAAPDSDEAVGAAVDWVRSAPTEDLTDLTVEPLTEPAAGPTARLLGSEILHHQQRFDEADALLRQTRPSSSDGSVLQRMMRVHGPRYQERRRFYACLRDHPIAARDVLEVGGTLPVEFVARTEPRSWTSLDLGAKTHDGGTFHRVVAGDAAEMPLDGESVDLVFSSSAFEHISRLGVALSEMFRVLRPGGIVYSDFGPIWSSEEGHHLRGAPKTALEEAGKWPLAPWVHLTATLTQMRQFLADGLDPDEAKRVERWIYRRDSLNRLWYEDYVHHFYSSGFKVEQLLVKEGQQPSAAVLDAVARRHPGRSNLHVTGFRVILQKPS